MPTPSSNPLPDQASPPLYGFSTCPDDQPHFSRLARQTHDTVRPQVASLEISQNPLMTIALPASYSSELSRGGFATGGSVLLGGQASSTDAAPRNTTAYPGPQSNDDLATSPMPSGRDGDDGKHQEVEPANRSSRESSATLSHLHTDNSSSMACEVDSFDLAVQEDECDLPSMGADYSNLRTIPITPSSYLRAGSRFCGTQQSERQVYDVQVEIKHVDLRESFLCGYLRIQGLTEDHPTLTTYFEGEIIGSKYSFFTKHNDWGASSKVDLNHWSKFSAFQSFQNYARTGSVIIPDVAQRDHIFMRWKEHFLVPDHRVRTITGASFEGFYYICFNQTKGQVSGIYFHSKSEKFQQLELRHVPDRGCFSAMEFR